MAPPGRSQNLLRSGDDVAPPPPAPAEKRVGHAMRVLVAALHPGYYRNLEPVMEALAARGHSLYLGSERPASSALGGESIVERLSLLPNVTSGEIPRREKDSFFIASKV